MKLVNKSIGAMFKRPSILVFLGIIFIGIISITFFTDALNVIFNQINSMQGDVTAAQDKNASDSVLKSVLSLYVVAFNFLGNAKILSIILISLLVGIVLFSGILALGFSGYFKTVYHALDKQRKVKNEFLVGIQRNFSKVWGTLILLFLVVTVIVIISLVACVPSIALLSAGISGDVNYMIWGTVLAVFTALVLFFAFMYSVIYISMWFPAIYTNERSPIRASKEVVNDNFWKIFARFFVLVVVYICLNLLVSSLFGFFGGPTALPSLAFSWLVNTLFFSFVTVYIFAIYRFLYLKRLP